MKLEPLTEEIPQHLARYITQQNPALYTPIDHACWRFILKLSKAFFEAHAHQKYLNGLKETGISIERIPLIEEMDRCLRRFHWRAVPVSGFIPPAAFMEFLSLGILPIACDMRTLEHIAYTPAPDIVHEAAGHAPIITDPEYAAYLRSYGEISKKAISSLEDLQVYEAIRQLSETKEDPEATALAISQAQDALESAIQSVTYTSEATLLSRMGWWTFEYGLFGSLSHPKIYGAGLLSSLSESFHYLDEHVAKLPFHINCTDIAYDITRPQPQLFVAPDFNTLRESLLELGNQMAFRRGGVEGLSKAIQCKTVTTTVLDTGIQISGVLSKIYQNAAGEPIYLNFTGPTQLSFADEEIPDHGTTYHSAGFGTPLTKIGSANLERKKLQPGNRTELLLDSGIKVEGHLEKILLHSDQPSILTFTNCTVSYGSEILFRPEWGTYDMVCGKGVTSVFGGPADRKKFGVPQNLSKTAARAQKSYLSSTKQSLCHLYQTVRTLRETPPARSQIAQHLEQIHLELESKHPLDWLLRFELLEILSEHALKPTWESRLTERLREIGKTSSDQWELIQRGMELLKRSH